MNELTKLRISLATKGRVPHNKGVRTKDLFKPCAVCTKDFYVRARCDLDRRKTCSWNCFKVFLSKIKRGAGNASWRGGITPENKRLRYTLEYRQWRTAVFERDNYTCQSCGARNGNGENIVLNADHIKPFAYYPKLRHEISNGRTLCEDCHALTDSYKNKGRWGYKHESVG